MTAPLHRRDPSRWVERRSQYIVQEHGVRGRLARAVAWSELGYSSSGIGRRLDVTEGTARSYLDEIEERWSESAAFARAESELAIEAAVGPGDGS